MSDERHRMLEAVKAGDAAAVARFLDHDPGLAGARDDQGLSVLLVALYHRQDAVCDVLLAGGRDLDVLEAAALGRPDRLRELLAADPGALAARTPEGFAPLHLASYFGGAGAVRALLAAGAAPEADADNPAGVRPLHSAASVGDSEAARVLLEAGANPDVRQRGGWTPLLAAAHADDVELARLLLAHGADPAITADDGRDAATMAADDGSERVGALLAAGDPPTPPMG